MKNIIIEKLLLNSKDMNLTAKNYFTDAHILTCFIYEKQTFLNLFIYIEYKKYNNNIL